MGCFGVGYSIMRIAMVQYLNGFSPKVGGAFGRFFDDDGNNRKALIGGCLGTNTRLIVFL